MGTPIIWQSRDACIVGRSEKKESPEWHRARAKSLQEHGFTKMAEEHEQIAQAIERRRQQQTR